jgi:hypothetical protein
MGTTKPATPKIGFGNPNIEACHRSNKGPHETNGLKSHERLLVGFCNDRTLSIKSAIEANKPKIPAIMNVLAIER